jgi:hypothetical protein
MIDLHSEQTKLSGRWIQKGFLAVAVLFNFCLIAQLLTVGLAVFDDRGVAAWRVFFQRQGYAHDRAFQKWEYQQKM